MRGLARRIRSFARLSGPRRRLFLEAWLLLPTVWVALRLAGFRRVHGAIEGRPLGAAGGPAPGVRAAAVEAVRLAGAHAPVSVNCLLESLVLCRVLRSRGIEADLRFGVRHEGGRFLAHAWVESDRVVLNDRPDVGEHYRPFREPIRVATRDWR